MGLGKLLFADHLLGSGQGNGRAGVQHGLVDAVVLHLPEGGILICPFAGAAALYQLPAGQAAAIQKRLLCVLFQIFGIGGQPFQLLQPFAQLFVGECSGLRIRFKPGQRAVLVLPCPAVRVSLAEAAVFAGDKLALAPPCHGGQLVPAPPVPS